MNCLHWEYSLNFIFQILYSKYNKTSWVPDTSQRSWAERCRWTQVILDSSYFQTVCSLSKSVCNEWASLPSVAPDMKSTSTTCRKVGGLISGSSLSSCWCILGQNTEPGVALDESISVKVCAWIEARAPAWTCVNGRMRRFECSD